MPERLHLVLCLVSSEAAPFGNTAGTYLAAQVLADPALAPHVDVQVLRLDSDDLDAAARCLREAAPDVIGFSCYAWSLGPTLAVARRLRATRPAPLVVLGGPLFAQLRTRDDWFPGWDAVDAIAVGDGEITLRALLAKLLRAGRPLRVSSPGPGLVLPGHPPAWGPPALEPVSIDEVVSPYLQGSATPVDAPHVELTRGCPFACAFCGCSRTITTPRLALPSRERVAGELAAIGAWPRPVEEVNLGSGTANLNDATWTLLRDAVHEGDPGARNAYSLQVRPELLKPCHAEGWKGARLRFALGVQSLAPATFGAMGRRTTLDDLARAVALLKDLGQVDLFFILGLPGETLASFLEGIDAALALGADRLAVSPLYVLPGTALHTHHETHGLAFDPDTFRVRSTPTLPAADVETAVARLRELDADLRRRYARGERFVEFDG